MQGKGVHTIFSGEWGCNAENLKRFLRKIERNSRKTSTKKVRQLRQKPKEIKVIFENKGGFRRAKRGGGQFAERYVRMYDAGGG